jgi:hypothetical protein
MSEEIGTAGEPAGEDMEEPKALGVEDIPGAVAPSAQAEKPPAPEGGTGALKDRLAALREQRAASGATGGGAAGPAGRRPGRPGRPQGQRGAQGGGRGEGTRAGAGAAARRGAQEEDPIAAGKKVLEQLSTRLAGSGEEKRGMQFAIRSLQRGYEALENETARLRGELERAHEAVRTMQRQGD